MEFYGAGKFSVFFAGAQLPVATVGSTTEATIYGADITAFPGRVGELRFGGFGRLDNIFFSTEPIPEPSTAALLGLGVLFSAWRFRRRSSPP